MRSVATETKA